MDFPASYVSLPEGFIFFPNPFRLTEICLRFLEVITVFQETRKHGTHQNGKFGESSNSKVPVPGKGPMWVSSQKNKHGEFQKTHLHIGYRFLFGAGAHPTISIHFPYEGMVHPITLLTCAAPKDGKFEALQGKIMEFNGQANGLFFWGEGGVVSLWLRLQRLITMLR